MKKFLLSWLLLAVVCIRVAAQEQENEDTQLWPDVTVGFKLNPTTTLSLFGTARLGRDLHARITHQLGASVNFRVNNYLNIVPSYRHAWSYPTENRRSQENRYFIDVTPRLPLPKGFMLQDRNRSEVRDINNRVSWRYRNRLQLEKSFLWHEHQLTAYLAGEIHYDSRYSGWNRKQFWAGTRVPLNKHLTLDLHYSRNLDAQARPGYWHVIGIFSRIEF